MSRALLVLARWKTPKHVLGLPNDIVLPSKSFEKALPGLNAESPKNGWHKDLLIPAQVSVYLR